jgi:hypothetical protein
MSKQGPGYAQRLLCLMDNNHMRHIPDGFCLAVPPIDPTRAVSQASEESRE